MKTILLDELTVADLKHYQRILAVPPGGIYGREIWDSRRLAPMVAADHHAPLNPGDLYIEVESEQDIAAAIAKIESLDDFPESRIVH